MSRAKKMIAVGVAVPAVMLALAIIWPMVAGDDEGNILAFPGFSLVEPILAAATEPFPDPDIGLASYVKLNPGEIDRDKLVRELFLTVAFAGDNYVIGTISVGRGDAFRGAVTVYIYADNEGWLMAYLSAEQIAADAVDFTGSVSVMRHALSIALTLTPGGDSSLILENIGFYHWAFPDATHFAIALGISNKNLYFAIPRPAVVKDISAACFAPNTVGANSQVLFDSSLIVSCTQSQFNSATIDVVSLGDVHTIKAGHSFGIGLIYQMPAP